MEENTTTYKFPPHIAFVITLIGIVLFFYLLIIGAGILIPLAFAFVTSMLLYPLCKRLENAKVPRGFAIAICLLLVTAVVVFIFWLIYDNLISFSEDVPQMKTRVQELLSLIQQRIEEYFKVSSEKQMVWLKKNADGFVSEGGKAVNGIINTTTSFVGQLLLIPIYTFFMLYYRGILKQFIRRIVNDEHIERAIAIELQIQNVLQKYVAGLFTVISIIAALNIVGLYAIGIKHALFFGILAAFLTIIPYIGIFIGSLLPIIYALAMTDSLFYPLAVFIWFQVVQVLEGNVITPNVVGSQVSINPLIAMLALLLGSEVWGIAGMILFVPMTAMLKVVLDNIPALHAYGYLLSEGDKTPPKPKNESEIVGIGGFFKRLFKRVKK